MNWGGLFIVAGYIGVIVIAWPWGLLAAVAHAATLLATARKRKHPQAPPPRPPA